MTASTPHDHAEIVPGRLEQIEARLAAASPGPWRADEYDAGHLVHDTVGDEVACVGWDTLDDSEDAQMGADAALIAHAPADLATLVAFAREISDAWNNAPGGEFLERVHAAFDTLEA